MALKEQQSQAPAGARIRISPAALIIGVAVLQLVIAAFLFWMAQLARESSAEHGLAITLGGVTAAIALVLALVLWWYATSHAARISSPAWLARGLPFVATGAGLVAAIGGWVPWLVLPLALLAPGPVAALGMVLPQYLTIVRDEHGGRANG